MPPGKASLGQRSGLCLGDHRAFWVLTAGVRPRGSFRPELHHRPRCDFLHPTPEGTAPRKPHTVPAEEGTASQDSRLLSCTGPRKRCLALGISWEWDPEQGGPGRFWHPSPGDGAWRLRDSV